MVLPEGRGAQGVLRGLTVLRDGRWHTATWVASLLWLPPLLPPPMPAMGAEGTSELSSPLFGRYKDGQPASACA